jgi:hypothetical protein
MTLAWHELTAEKPPVRHARPSCRASTCSFEKENVDRRDKPGDDAKEERWRLRGPIGAGTQRRYPPTFASTSDFKNRSMNSMKPTEGTSRIKAVIAAIW